MQYQVYAHTVTGRVRRNNQDNFSLNQQYLQKIHPDADGIKASLAPEQTHLLGVYDGMGGHLDGELASYLMAKEAAGENWLDALSEAEDPAAVLHDLCLEANEVVCREADGSGMGTTCAMLCLRDAGYTVCNVGDSPVFLLRSGQLWQLTQDHNTKSTYEKIHGCPAPENMNFPLTQCIGIPSDEMTIEPYGASGPVEPGDMFLICSDGITKMLPLMQIGQILLESLTVSQAGETLIRLAMEAGGRDNATVICVKAEPEKKTPGFFNRFVRKTV